jgi:hypothetical protein
MWHDAFFDRYHFSVRVITPQNKHRINKAVVEDTIAGRSPRAYARDSDV